ncbi:hypothetical protein VTI74DRAFT_10128 [Chaetomium olivicolor]
MERPAVIVWHRFSVSQPLSHHTQSQSGRLAALRRSSAGLRSAPSRSRGTGAEMRNLEQPLQSLTDPAPGFSRTIGPAMHVN